MFPNEPVKDLEQKKFRANGDDRQVAVVVENGSPIPVEAAENLAQQILKAVDSHKSYTWLDFENKRLRRVATAIYTAASVGAYTLTVTYHYTLVSGEYRFDGTSRSIA